MKIGLITYHSAYNFGSVLQAYATQEAIKKISGNCEIINYRTNEQKRVYAIFKLDFKHNFFKSIIKNVFALSNLKSKIERKNKYEQIINEIFNLSVECKDVYEVNNIWNKYDVIVSGSDQIWNKHSNELENVDWQYMYPYLLRGFKGKKVSYASSLTNMKDNEIKKILNDIKDFDNVSIREKETTDNMKKKYNINAVNVLDPTFLLTRDEWIEKFKLKRNNCLDNYILYYALGKRKYINEEIKKLKKYADLNNLKIKVIAPLSYIKKINGVEYLIDVDPKDFLKLINDSNYVITDSYHGTILSINLQKNIYSLCKGNPSDFRKTDVLKKLGLDNRIISNIDEFEIKSNSMIDYSTVNKKIEYYRKESLEYLKKSLEEK